MEFKVKTKIPDKNNEKYTTKKNSENCKCWQNCSYMFYQIFVSFLKQIPHGIDLKMISIMYFKVLSFLENQQC